MTWRDLSYASAFLSNRAHWVRQLPGQLFHNIISHGIAKLAEFLDEVVEIIATAYQSDQLQSLGAEEVFDELRVLIRDKRGTTAFFCFSTQIKGLNQLRIHGPANSIIADIITGSLVRSQPVTQELSYLFPSSAKKCQRTFSQRKTQHHEFPASSSLPGFRDERTHRTLL